MYTKNQVEVHVVTFFYMPDLFPSVFLIFFLKWRMQFGIVGKRETAFGNSLIINIKCYCCFPNISE